MSSLRAAAVFGLAALLSSALPACRSPGEGGAEPSPAKSSSADVTLKGVDTSALTAREKSDWSRLVSELLAPCTEHPVSLAQCVNEARACKACLPAAKMLSEQVRRGAPRSQLEAVYKARFSPDAVKSIDLSGAPRKGATNAAVTLAEFADFECPACGSVRRLLDELLKKYPNDVALVFKHFPLSMHPNAEKAARAAVAAHRQNKFWDMHSQLFDNQQKLDAATIDQIAKSIGLDPKQYMQDRDSEATADAVARDRKQGEALGIVSTPSVFINGRLLTTSSDFAEDLEQWVALEIELVSGRPAVAAEPAAPTPAPSASAPGAASAAPAPGASVPGAPAASAGPIAKTAGVAPKGAGAPKPETATKATPSPSAGP
jgi:protein-disulfide isomerase